MSDAHFFQTIEQTLTLPYQENPGRYDDTERLLSYWLSIGYDESGNLFSGHELQKFAQYRDRLVAKKAEDLEPRIGGSTFI